MMDWIQKWFFKEIKAKFVDAGAHPDVFRGEQLRCARNTIRCISTRYIVEYVASQNFTGREQLDIVDTDITQGEDAMIEHFLNIMGYAQEPRS